MIITLSYLVGQDYTLPWPSNKYLYYLEDTARIEHIGSNAEIVKKELRKIIKNINEDVTISYSTHKIQAAVIQEAVTERKITGYRFPNNRAEDAYLSALLSMSNPTQIEADLLKRQFQVPVYQVVDRTPRKVISPRKEIRKNKTIALNEIVATKNAEWSNVIDFYGGYAEVAEAGISKDDLYSFRIKAKLKNIELISPTECYANITLEGDKNFAFKYHNISKSDYKYRGTYKVDEIDAIDIYNMTKPIVFSFDEKEYLNTTQITVPLEQFLDNPVVLKENYKKYRTTIIQLLDDFTHEDWKLREQVREVLRQNWAYLENERWGEPGYFDYLPSERIELELVAMKKYAKDSYQEGMTYLFGCCILPIVLVLMNNPDFIE